MQIFNPADLEEDEFLAGPDRYEDFDEAEDGDLLDIDDIFGKDLETVLRDCSVDGLESGIRTPSAIREGYAFLDVEDGVVLIDSEDRIVGAYLGCDLAVCPDHQGLGLGAELVLEYAMRNGCLPTWWLDEAAYTNAGEAAHRSAWHMACDAELYGRKAALLAEAARASAMAPDEGPRPDPPSR